MKNKVNRASSEAKKNNLILSMKAEKDRSVINGERTLVKQPTNHPLITHLRPTIGSRLDAIRKYAAMVVLMLFIGVGNVWGYDAHFSLRGTSSNISSGYSVNTYFGTDSKYCIYYWLTKNETFYLTNGSNNYGPSSNNKEVKHGTTAAKGGIIPTNGNIPVILDSFVYV